MRKLLSRTFDGLVAARREHDNEVARREYHNRTQSAVRVGQKPDALEVFPAKVKMVDAFLTWLSEFLIDCLYPGASIERVSVALELILILLREWSPERLLLAEAEWKWRPFASLTDDPRALKVLFQMLTQSWDLAQSTSWQILREMAEGRGWPGLSDPLVAQSLVEWGVRQSLSPRKRESNTGAQVLRLAFSGIAQKGFLVTFNEDGSVRVTHSPGFWSD